MGVTRKTEQVLPAWPLEALSFGPAGPASPEKGRGDPLLAGFRRQAPVPAEEAGRGPRASADSSQAADSSRPFLLDPVPAFQALGKGQVPSYRLCPKSCSDLT